MQYRNLAVLPSLRLRARPFVLAIFTLIGLGIAQASWNSYRTAREDALRAYDDATRFAQETLRHQRAVVDQTFHLLRVLNGISLPGDPGSDACATFLARQLDRFPDYENLAFLRGDGSVRCSGRASPLPEIVTASAQTSSANPLLLAFRAGSVTALLPHDADNAEHAVAAVFPLRNFLIDAHSTRLDASFAILDKSGKVLATYPERSDGWSDRPADFTQSLLALDAGAARRIADADGEHLYLAQPIAGTPQELRLAIRLPADAARNLTYQAALLVAALTLSAFTAWLLLRIALARAAAALQQADWTRFRLLAFWRRAWRALGARIRKPGTLPARARRGPGETTILRAAYEDLKRAFNDKEERMQQIILLDELSRTAQVCHDLNELAQAIARCATALFPGSGGALLQRGAPNQVETVLAWGDSSPMGTLSLPLIVNDETLGILNLNGVGRYDPWAATSLAERAAMGMVAVKRQEQLRYRAMRDPLTGLYNRRFLEEALDIEQRRAMRRSISIGMLMLDIDHFKRFNDTYGHDAGDLLLRGMGALLRRTVREGDMPCRYGGEEFVIILPGADLAGTRQRAEALRAAIARWDPQRDGESLGPVTASIGVAVLPMHGATWQQALKAADDALYEAKRSGRNRVVCTTQPAR